MYLNWSWGEVGEDGCTWYLLGTWGSFNPKQCALCQGLDLNFFISVSALMLHPLQSQVKPRRGRSAHICLKAWCSCSKQSYCQKPPPGAKGMWKILATMTAAVMEAVSYLLISGCFSNSISWACLLPLLPPQPLWRHTLQATEYS